MKLTTILLLIIVIVIIGAVIIFWFNRKPADIQMTDVVPNLNLKRYSGVWYEIAKLPNPFESGCTNSMAIYSRSKNPNGFRVTNQCVRNGQNVTVRGEADAKFKAISEGVYPGSFKVKFENYPFAGDYNVYYVDDQYQNALVGTTDRKYLWMLSRSPHADPDMLHYMIDYAKKIGFNVNNLEINNSDR